MNSHSARIVRPFSRYPILTTGIPITFLMVSLSGCGFPATPGGGVGVTTGGQQDIAAARAIIEDGSIPDPSMITVEGFLSEHTIPIEVPQDAGHLYASASAAWNGDFDTFTPMATVMIGFGSTIDRETFVRDRLNLCLVIDASGSMNDLIDVRSGTTKLDAVKIAVDRLLAQLDANDRVSVVSFNTIARLRVEAVAGDDIVAVKSAMDEIVPEGNTNLAAGMRKAYRTVRAHQSAERADRLIVLTDALLTVRPDVQDDEILDVMQTYADLDVGATIFAVGNDFGYDIAYRISQIRGSNYFFLSDYDRIVSVFDEEFDLLVTPAAYDVTLATSVPYTFDVVDVYGIPAEAPFPHELTLEIPTLFLSSREGGGALFVRLRAGALADFASTQTVADITLSYTDRQGATVTDAPIQAVLPAGLDPESNDPYFPDAATQRGVLLLNTALAIRNGCDDVSYDWDDCGWFHCDYDPPDFERAIERLTEFLPYFDAQAEELPDRASDSSRSLSEERALVVRLLDNAKDLNRYWW